MIEPSSLAQPLDSCSCHAHAGPPAGEAIARRRSLHNSHLQAASEAHTNNPSYTYGASFAMCCGTTCRAELEAQMREQKAQKQQRKQAEAREEQRLLDSALANDPSSRSPPRARNSPSTDQRASQYGVMQQQQRQQRTAEFRGNGGVTMMPPASAQLGASQDTHGHSESGQWRNSEAEFATPRLQREASRGRQLGPQGNFGVARSGSPTVRCPANAPHVVDIMAAALHAVKHVTGCMRCSMHASYNWSVYRKSALIPSN